MRFRNSGLNIRLISARAELRMSSNFIIPPSDWKPRAESRLISRTPALEVMMSTVFRKETVCPRLSCELPLLQHLQQDVEHVRVRLLDLVEQDDRVGPAADLLGEKPALLVAHVSRRRSDQTGHVVLLHEVGHVDPDQGVLVAEQELEASVLASRVLPTPVGPRKMKEPTGRLGELRPVRDRWIARDHGVDGVVLADDLMCAARPDVRTASGIRLGDS
jgi:hypothetical protein